jgi:hypothetical protein
MIKYIIILSVISNSLLPVIILRIKRYDSETENCYHDANNCFAHFLDWIFAAKIMYVDIKY